MVYSEDSSYPFVYFAINKLLPSCSLLAWLEGAYENNEPEGFGAILEKREAP